MSTGGSNRGVDPDIPPAPSDVLLDESLDAPAPPARHRFVRRADVLWLRYPAKLAWMVSAGGGAILLLAGLTVGWWAGWGDDVRYWTGLGVTAVHLDPGRVVFDGWVQPQFVDTRERTMRVRVIEGAQVAGRPARVVIVARRVRGMTQGWGEVRIFVDVRQPGEGPARFGAARLDGFVAFPTNGAYLCAGPLLDRYAARSLVQAAHRILMGRERSELTWGGRLSRPWRERGRQRGRWRAAYAYFMQRAQRSRSARDTSRASATQRSKGSPAH